MMNLDVLKLIIVLMALIWLNLGIRPPRIISPDYWVMNIGLLLLLFASVLDFADGIKSLDNFPILGDKAPFHDTLEDQFFDMPGLAIFILGAFREILRKKGRERG